MSIEETKQALEELEHIKAWCLRSLGIGLVNENVLASLRQAIAEAEEQEPVGWLDGNDRLAEFMHKDLKTEHDKRGSSTPKMFPIPVYTHPQPKAEQERKCENCGEFGSCCQNMSGWRKRGGGRK